MARSELPSSGADRGHRYRLGRASAPLRSRVAHRATLSSVLQRAVDSGLRPDDPVHGVRGPARTPLRRRRPVLEPEQWPQLRREFRDHGPGRSWSPASSNGDAGPRCS